MLVQLRAIVAAVVAGVLFCAVPAAASAGFVQAPASPYGVGSEEIQGVATGDLNGDGRSDAVVVNWGPLFAEEPSYSALLAGSDGSLSLASGSPVVLPETETPYRVALGDVDGNGKLDLIMTQEGKVTVRLGNGDGTFASTPVATLTAGASPLSVASGDLDGDGYDDVVVGNYGVSSVSVFYSQGDGSFTEAPASPYAVGSEPRTVAIGDFDGDERGDIVTANQGASFAGAFSVLLAQADGSYAPAPDGSLEGEYQQMAVAAGDFDGDGNLDLAGVASPNQVVSVYLGDGSGQFTLSSGMPSIPSHWGEDLAVADFDGDGRDDIAVPVSFSVDGEEDSTVWVFAGEGDGGFAPGVSYSIEPGSYPNRIATGDFNGDGRPDLVTANGSSDLTVLLDAEAEMVVEPAELDFGEAGVGTAAGPEAVTITNEGLAPLQLGDIELSGADSGDFSFDGSDCGDGTIQPGESCEVEVEFAPIALGAREATLEVPQESGPAAEVELSGEGAPNPGIAVTPREADFGSQMAGGSSGPARSFTVESVGTTPLEPGPATIGGADPADFRIASDGCAGKVLAPAETCLIEVSFAPSAAGARSARLEVPSNAGPSTVSLAGTGFIPSSGGPSRLPACAPISVRKVALYKVKTRGTPKRPGLRARFTTGAPALVEVAATLRYHRHGPRSASLGKSKLRVKGRSANYKVPLPTSLRSTLRPGAKVTLKLRYRTKRLGPGCSFGPAKLKSLATRIVWIAR